MKRVPFAAAKGRMAEAELHKSVSMTAESCPDRSPLIGRKLYPCYINNSHRIHEPIGAFNTSASGQVHLYCFFTLRHPHFKAINSTIPPSTTEDPLLRIL